MPPAYEVLLLNTAIPQIQAAQSGDTYVVPRDIAFSTVANLANGTNLLPSLTFSSDTNTGIYREGADALGFTAGGGTNQMVLTTTGLGIGTSSAYASSRLSVAGVGYFAGDASSTQQVRMGFTNGTSYWWMGRDNASTGDLIVGQGGGGTQLTLTTSGNLGLGVSPSAWAASSKAITIGFDGGMQLAGGTSNTQALLTTNLVYTGTGATGWKLPSNVAGTYYEQYLGAHKWHYANANGVDGDATPIQAMTLDASGNLAVGDTSSSRRLKAKFDSNTVYSASSMETTSLLTYITNGSTTVGAYSGIHFNTGGDGDAAIAGVRTAAGDMALTFGTRSTGSGNIIERARITSGGVFQVSSGGSVQVGGTAARATTAGTNRLDIFNGTAPVGTLTDGISIYSSSGEAYVMDAAGNATLFSPHDAETNEWIFKSKHTPTGKVLKIDVERLLKFVNDHFGLDAVHEFVEK